MMKKVTAFQFLFLFVILFSVIVSAQEGPILWQDNFDDDDPAARKNVGWIYYGEEDIAGQVIQQQDGMLYMKAGSYGGLAGVALVETNGVPELVFDEAGDPTPETMAALLKNDYSDPNQIITFQVNFLNVTSSFFILGTRMVLDSTRGDADPTESPAYTLFISPLEGVVRIGRYDAELAALDPGSWTYFGEATFSFTFDVMYWVKYYLKDGDLKVKIWEGEPEDEPAEWLIEGVDPDPRVEGKFTMFGLLGAPPGGDEMFLDNITVRSTEAAANPVTFQVNMSVQEALGNFNPSADMVVVRGSFNGWAGNDDQLTLGDTPDVYQITKNFDDSFVGTEIQYKFVIVPASGDDIWESIDNRVATIQAGGQVLDVVYFNNRESIGATANVTFQADMSDMLSKGWFDPATDQMRVTGAMNGWASMEDWALQADLLDPSLYLLTKEITEEPGNTIEWKFRGYPHENFLDNGWEAGSNHSFTFTGEDLVLEKIKPNVLPAGKDLTQDVTVRFSVDCNGAVDWYNKKPFPTIDGVYLNGDFVPLGTGGWAGWTVSDTAGGALVKMYDDGSTNGDAVAGDNIWTTEVVFPAGSKATHLYKYGIYSVGYTDTLNAGNIPMDNEAGFAMNHVILITDTSPLFVNDTDIFGSQWREVSVERQPTAQVPSDYVLEQNFPNPFNPTTEISYTIPRNGHVTLAIYNAMGQKIATLVDGQQTAGRYRAEWNGMDDNGNRMSSGIYFYRLQADGVSKTMKMVMMK